HRGGEGGAHRREADREHGCRCQNAFKSLFHPTNQVQFFRAARHPEFAGLTSASVVDSALDRMTACTAQIACLSGLWPSISVGKQPRKFSSPRSHFERSKKTLVARK